MAKSYEQKQANSSIMDCFTIYPFNSSGGRSTTVKAVSELYVSSEYDTEESSVYDA